MYAVLPSPKGYAMSLRSPIIDVRQAYLRAVLAEEGAQWHLVVQHCLYCFEEAREAQDERAVRFFAAKLVTAYERMKEPYKAAFYRTFV